MSSKKSLAQLRGDIVADIDAVRLGTLPKETATVIFDGIKTLDKTINTEVALFKASLQAKQAGMAFAKTVRLGQRVVNEEDTEA